jgi:protein-S-isoprenylcysteine O-methyltransferase Ste14
MLILRSIAAVVIIVAIWFVGFPALLIWLRVDPFPLRLGPLRIAGTVPLAIGAWLFLWVTWTFAVVGRGTPLIFDAPTRFVAVGPLRYVRNPMYLADVLILLGLALLLESAAILIYAAVFWLALHVLVVTLEEPRLRRRFGTSYELYCRRVPRWLPRLGGGVALD